MTNNKQKKENKKGGSFEYAKQFNYPLSPCYHQNGKSIFKAGWHSGGSQCNNELSVSQMGVIDKPLVSKPNPSQTAWSQRYNCGATTGGMKLPNYIKEKQKYLNNQIIENIKNNVETKKTLTIKGKKENGHFDLEITYKKNNEKPYHLSVSSKKNNNKTHNYKSWNTLKRKLHEFELKN